MITYSCDRCRRVKKQDYDLIDIFSGKIKIGELCSDCEADLRRFFYPLPQADIAG